MVMAIQPGAHPSQIFGSDTNGPSSQTTASSQVERDHSISPGSSSRLPRAHLEISDIDLTPPTSSSGLSSQEGLAPEDRRPTLSLTNGARVGSTPVLSPRWSAQSYSSPVNPAETSTALKRTSSGFTKRSSIQGTQYSKQGQESKPRHSRNSSVLSNGTTVTELSQQLRTRLSYAMLKVQNGWESNTLEEIESLTVGSPHRPPVSPVTATSIDSKLDPSRSYKAPGASNSYQKSQSSTFGPVSAPDGRFQASFRAERDLDSGHGGGYRSMDGYPGRALAPPADIAPRPRRRPHPANVPFSEYNTLDSQTSTQPKPRTVSQNAAMEADAVETLLFLASPGNSGTHPSRKINMTSPTDTPTPASARYQPSPAKPAFAIPDQIAFSPTRYQEQDTRLSRQRPGTVPLVSPRYDVDRMIDNFDDSSTDGSVERGVFSDQASSSDGAVVTSRP